MKQLNDRYGDKDQTVMSAVRRLVLVSLPRGPAHRKIEVILAGVMEARRSLRAVGAEESLFAGCHTIGTLVGKLAEETQSTIVSPSGNAPRPEKGQGYWIMAEEGR